jgi:hypothetical protein
MLTIQVLRSHGGVVHVNYSESGRSGHLSGVYPGGTFMGFSFERLREMGNGEHRVVALDPYDFSKTGEAPRFKSEWEAKFFHFQSVLFGYQVGVYTALEVLSVADEVSAVRRANEA